MSAAYFASDFHLGTPNYTSSLEREKKIVSWLQEISDDCDQLFLLGDVFDFWFEYKSVVPKYYVRLLGQLASMADHGTTIYFFKGNHDMWTFDYLSKEIGIKVIDEEWVGDIEGKRFYLHHGDALWKGEVWYKFIRMVFRSRWATWLFHRLHPNFGIALAQYFSKSSRKKNSAKDNRNIPLEQEFQYQFAMHHNKSQEIDFYIFGHRHKPMDKKLENGTRFINLGDWVTHFTYAKFNGNTLDLKSYTV